MGAFKKQLVKDLVERLESFGYKCRVYPSCESGYFTDGVNMVLFEGSSELVLTFYKEYSRVTYINNYTYVVTSTIKGIGCGCLIGKIEDSYTKEGCERLLKSAPPDWALKVCGEWVPYHEFIKFKSLEEHKRGEIK